MTDQNIEKQLVVVSPDLMEKLPSFPGFEYVLAARGDTTTLIIGDHGSHLQVTGPQSPQKRKLVRALKKAHFPVEN